MKTHQSYQDITRIISNAAHKRSVDLGDIIGNAIKRFFGLFSKKQYPSMLE